MGKKPAIHIAQSQSTRNTLRHSAWLNASGHLVRPAGVAEFDIYAAAPGGSVI